MRATTTHHHHLSLPHFHIHSPHVEWQELEHPIRATLLVATCALTLAVGAVAVRESPGLLERATPVAATALERVDLTRHYRPRQGRPAHFEHMYGGHAAPRDVRSMYHEPRSRRY